MFPKSALILTDKQTDKIRLLDKVLSMEVRASKRALNAVSGRYMDIYLPHLLTMLNNAGMNGMSRYPVAKAFTSAGIKMDFHFAQKLLAHAVKKRKAVLLNESGQANDDIYCSRSVHRKHIASKE